MTASRLAPWRTAVPTEPRRCSAGLAKVVLIKVAGLVDRVLHLVYNNLALVFQEIR